MKGTSMGGREYTSGLISPDCAEADRDSGLSSPPPTVAAECGCGEEELEAVDSSSRSEFSFRESENEN